MPSKEAHLAAASRNQGTVSYLLQGDDTHLPWVVSVAFYKALHIVEAVFAADPSAPCDHCDDHRQRNHHLKTTNRYNQLWKMYRPLFEASLVARYLHETNDAGAHVAFTDYMNRDAVQAKVLNHYLKQIESTACNLLQVTDLYA